MGVSGCGKSSVGEALSQRLAIPYRDADPLHPPQNVALMRAGIPLKDEDRWPWLDIVGENLRDQVPLIMGCSALKRVYRDRISAKAGGAVTFVHLVGSRDVIAARMAERAGHYMPLSLLDSQFATLEPPSATEAISVNIDQPLDQIADEIVQKLTGGME